MPESDDLLQTASSLVHAAALIVDAGVPASAAREAYLAALNAARAVIFEKTRKSSKTHGGTKATFNKLVHEGMTFPAGLIDFLEDGYRLKTDADYGTRKQADDRAARDAIETARAFVAACTAIVRAS